ncbi:MAG: HPr family phosphocarrier protein [Deferribacterota bacterium]|nr:HPr family phosphocarrier protein [Deferribacterota bacterium]
MEEIRHIITLVNELGLHARAAAIFVKKASEFESTITVIKDGVEADGKSILSLMMLAAPKGSELELVIKGEDAKDALEALKELIYSRFGENK